MITRACKCGGIVKDKECSRCGPVVKDHNGTKAIIRSRKYRDWLARLVKQRGAICRMCWEQDGRSVKYEQAHHVKPRATHPELTMVASNIELLCERHHDQVEYRQANL